jgi:hypothetical protein
MFTVIYHLLAAVPVVLGGYLSSSSNFSLHSDARASLACPRG